MLAHIVTHLDIISIAKVERCSKSLRVAVETHYNNLWSLRCREIEAHFRNQKGYGIATVRRCNMVGSEP